MNILKNQVTTIDDEDDDDNNVPASVSDGIYVPIICLSDDSDVDDDDAVDDKEYTKFLDNLRDDKRLGPIFESSRSNVKYEVDNGVFDIRKYAVSSKTPLTRRIQRDIEQKKRKSEIPRVPDVKIIEDIQRDNRAFERRRRLTETMAACTSRAVPLRRIQEDKQRSNSVCEQRKRKFAEIMVAEASKEVPLVIKQEGVQRDNSVGEQKKKEFAETMAAETSRAVLVATTQEKIERDNSDGEHRKMEFAETMAAEGSRDVPLGRTQEDKQRENSVGEQRKKEFAETMAAETSKAVLVARTQEDIERDNSICEQREMVFSETEATVAFEDVSLVTTQEDTQRNSSIDEWLNCSKNVGVTEVNETLEDAPVTQINKGGGAGRKNKTEESLATADEDYMNYLKWLVTNLKAAVSEKNPSNSNQDTPKESTITPGMNLLPVKIELDTGSWSDSEVVVLGDSRFMKGEGTTPFVVSKSEKVIAIDESINPGDEDQSSHWFKEKLMDILARPYDEKELWQLSHEVSIHKQRTRCRELRDGREHTYATNTLASSYLDLFPDFSRDYKPIQRTDRHRALKLLRGFFFYLKNVAHEGAFKPWLTNNFN